MVLNGQTSVPWKVEIKYSTMGWFHYGNTERYWQVDKGIFDDLRRFVCRFQALKGPLRSPTVLNGQTSGSWEVKMKYFTMGWFHYGITERLLTWEVNKGIFDNLRHFFCCFQAMKSPQGSRMVLNGHTSVPWKVEMKYSTMGIFHYGNTERYSLKRWTKEYLMI